MRPVPLPTASPHPPIPEPPAGGPVWRDSQGALFRPAGPRREDHDGSICALDGHPEQAARLFDPPPGDTDEQYRLKAMTLSFDESLEEVADWPRTLLGNPQEVLIGYLMPVRPTAGLLADLLDVRRARRVFPQADFAFRIRVAQRLAQAVSVIHEHGYVLGYFDPEAIAVCPEGNIRLQHCHRFQIQGWNRVFPARPGPAEYQAPELQGERWEAGERTRDQDHFSLAVLIYRVLMMGEHPFDALCADGSRSVLTVAIADYAYVHDEDAEQAGIRPVPGALPPDILPNALRHAFAQAFAPLVGADSRPKAEDWIDTLRRMARTLRVCPRAAWHQYREGLAECPWCHRMEHSRISDFQPDDAILSPPADNTPEWEELATAISALKELPPPVVSEPAVKVKARPLRLTDQPPATLLGRLKLGMMLWFLGFLFRLRPSWRKAVFRQDLLQRRKHLTRVTEQWHQAREKYADNPEERAFRQACEDALAITAAFSSQGSIILEGDAGAQRRRGLQAQLEKLRQERERLLLGRSERETEYRRAWKALKQAQADLAVVDA